MSRVEPDFDKMSDKEYKAYVAKRLKREEKKKNEEIKKFLKTKFKDASNFRVLSKADILWAGWECDPNIWLCQVDHHKVLVATNHGGYEIAHKSLLDSKSQEYIKLASIYFNWLADINNAEKLKGE